MLMSTACSYEQDVVDAKMKELEKFKDNEVYEETDNTNQSTVGVRWDVTKKPNGDNLLAAAPARSICISGAGPEFRRNSRRASPVNRQTCSTGTVRARYAHMLVRM